MKDRQYGYIYDGTFEGFLTAAVVCLRQHRAPAFVLPYHPAEGADAIRVKTDPSEAEHLYSVIGSVADAQAQQNCLDFFLTCACRKEITLFAYIYKALVTGPSISEDYSDPTVKLVREAVLDLYREAQTVQTDLCFTEEGGLSAAVIDPRNSVLPLIRNQVLRRADIEDVALYDRRHCLLLRRKGEFASLADIRHLAVPAAACAGRCPEWKRGTRLHLSQCGISHHKKGGCPIRGSLRYQTQICVRDQAFLLSSFLMAFLMILPLKVLGSSSTNSTIRGYL